MDALMEASDVGVNVEETMTSAGFGLSPSIDLPSPPPKVPQGKLMLRNMVVLNPPRQPSLPTVRRHKMEGAPQKT